MASFKIFFMADIHNSELVFRRFLSVPKHYDVDIMILSGDLTGKAIIPIVDLGGGRYQYSFRGKSNIVDGPEELERAKSELMNSGIYPYVCTRDEVEELKNDPEKVDKLFSKLITREYREMGLDDRGAYPQGQAGNSHARER